MVLSGLCSLRFSTCFALLKNLFGQFFKAQGVVDGFFAFLWSGGK